MPGEGSRGRMDARERYFSRRFQIGLVFEGALVGLAGGVVVTLYRVALSWAESTLRGALATWASTPIGFLGLALLVALMMLVVGRLMLWEPYTTGSGIPQVDAEVAGRIDMPWHRVMGAKFAEGIMATLSGLSLGREGPAVQLGGMAGKMVSKLFKRERGEERILITCGAGAGMAAAFQAPLTGVMFALEEIHKVFSAPLIISVMMSSIVADFFVSGVLGVTPVLHLTFLNDLPHMDYLLVVVFGILMGVVGALYNKGMFLSQDLFKKIPVQKPYGRLAVAFALSLVMMKVAPVLLCGGDAIIGFLSSREANYVQLVLVILLGKYFFTTVCFGSNAPGGTLLPLVVMGALAGFAYGLIAARLTGMPVHYARNFLVLGITGLFAGSVRAPVTAIILTFELTGSLDSMLAASVVSISSYVVANLMKSEPYYEHLLANMMGVAVDDEKITHAKSNAKIIHTHMVEAGSPVEGHKISEIDWPEGMLVVTITRSGVEMVAHGDTSIQALDQLLVIMDVAHEDEIERKLRRLCHSGLGMRGR
jgi:H+/Cl- antiporter ClcA